jgi:hypothetical protein
LKSSTNLEVSKLEEMSKYLSRANDSDCIKYYSDNTNFKKQLFGEMFEAQFVELERKYKTEYANLCDKVNETFGQKILFLEKGNFENLTDEERYKLCVECLIDDPSKLIYLKKKSPQSIRVPQRLLSFKKDLLNDQLKIVNIKDLTSSLKVSFDSFDFKEIMSFMEKIKSEIYSVNFKESLGCTNYCPFCTRKCNGVVGCQNHSTDHLLASWGGCGKVDSNLATLKVCNSKVNFKSNWVYGDDTLIFPKLVETKYPEWFKFMNSSLISLSEEQKQDWKRIGKEVCKMHNTVYHEDFLDDQ